MTTAVCICDRYEPHPWCPVHHPETIGVDSTHSVTLLGGPRDGEVQEVHVWEHVIYVNFYPEIQNSMRVIKGKYYRVPVSLNEVGAGYVFLWQLDADTTKGWNPDRD